MQEKGADDKFPLIPYSFESDNMDFYIQEEFGKLDISFQRFNGEIIFDYERDLMHKVSFQKKDFR